MICARHLQLISTCRTRLVWKIAPFLSRNYSDENNVLVPVPKIQQDEQFDPFESIINNLGKLGNSHSNKSFKSNRFIIPESKIALSNIINNRLDSIIKGYLEQEKVEKAMQYLMNRIRNQNDILPFKKTFYALASKLSETGNVRDIEILEQAFATFYSDGSGITESFDHYKADALVNSGNITEAIATLRILHHQYPQYEEVVMISKIAVKLLYKVIFMDLKEHTVAVHNFVVYTMSNGNFLIASTWWKCCFLQSSTTYHCLYENLLEEKMELLRYIPQTFPAIIQEAVKSNDKDMLLRLLQVVLKHQMKAQVTPVLSIYLEYFCDLSDYANARKVYKFAVKHQLYLTLRSVDKFIVLIAFLNKDPPQELLQRKSKTANLKPKKELPYNF